MKCNRVSKLYQMISGPFCLCGFYILLIFDDTMKISVFTLGHPQLTSRKQFGDLREPGRKWPRTFWFACFCCCFKEGSHVAHYGLELTTSLRIVNSRSSCLSSTGWNCRLGPPHPAFFCWFLFRTGLLPSGLALNFWPSFFHSLPAGTAGDTVLGPSRARDQAELGTEQC